METLKSILPLLWQGDWTVSIDLKDAYHHVLIAEGSRRLLGFSVNGQLYRFRALPFGLKPAPRLFTRLVGCVAAFLRERGLRIFCYLDDWLLAAESRELLLTQLNFLLRTVQSLGFLINWEKSELTPTRRPIFLGAAVSIPEGLARPSPERVEKVSGAARRLRRRHRAPARVWLQFLGYLASLVDVLPDCRLYMRPFQLHLLRHYRPSRDHLSRMVPNPPAIRLLIVRWTRREFLNQGKFIWPLQPTVTVTTDASHQGWGGHCMGHTAFGDWPRAGPRPHINILEFKAVLLSLQSFLPHIRHRSVLIRTDNVTVAAYINRQGGTHSVRLNTLAAQLWAWCRQEGLAHTGTRESDCGFSVQGAGAPLRVDDAPGHNAPPPADVRPTSGGPVRLRPERAPPAVLRQDAGHSGMADRRVLVQVDRDQGVRPSPIHPHPPSPPQGTRGRCMVTPHSPPMAAEELVSGHDGPPCGAPIHSPPSPGPSLSAGVRNETPAAERAPPDCLALVRESGTQAGLSERAAALVAGSRRESTLESYNSRLACFFQWCETVGVTPRSASISHIADFLISIFDKGRSISTIRGYRSAIAAVHADGAAISNSATLGKLIRALFLQRPPTRKLLPSWSLPKVLEALAGPPFEPLAEASLRDVTIKTVFLVAIASGQRRSALHALSAAPGHIRWEPGGVRLIPNPSYIAKNQTSSSSPVEIFIQPLSAHSSIGADKVWCPVRALKYYWHRTKDKRSRNQLFIITKEPFSPASRDTISRWIVAAIQAAGPEALAPGNVPRAHDTRSVATSWALFNGVSVEEIHKAAYWRSPNSFISFYLKDVPAAEPSFSRAALSAAAGTH